MLGTPQFNSITLIDKEDFSLQVDYTDSHVVLHLPKLNKLTKTILQDLTWTIEDLYLFLRTTGYEGMWCAIEPSNTIVTKLAKLVGFVEIGSNEGMTVFEFKGII